MSKFFALFLFVALPAQAEVTFTCTQLDRVSLAAEGAMRPLYEGRVLNFTWADGGFSGDGAFYHDDYTINSDANDSFRAHAENGDRSDLFRFENGILMHTAIVKYGQDPSIQSQVFRCKPAE